MVYRDDREALRARNEELERELTDLRRRLELPPAPSPPRRVRWRVVLVAVTIVLLGPVFAAGLVDRPLDPASAIVPGPLADPTSEPRSTPVPIISKVSRPHRPSRGATPHQGPGVIDHEYQGTISRTTGASPLFVSETCRVKVNASPWHLSPPELLWCEVNLECAGIAVHEAATVKCMFDENGSPRSTPLQKPIRPWPTEVRMDRSELEFISNVDGDVFTWLMDLSAPES